MKTDEKRSGKYESRFGKDSGTQTMDYTHTEAHQMAYDFSVYIHKKVLKFPKYEKFNLSKDIKDVVDDLMDEIEMYEIAKAASHLYAADRLKRKLVRKTRLAHDLKYSAMNDSSYGYCSQQIAFIGACVGGMIKKVQAEKKR